MRFAVLFLLVCAALPAEVRSARVTGSPNDNRGWCVVKVSVDGIAEIDIRGGEGNLRTLQGAPARWVELECNQALPNSPTDFRFRGIDGRGNVQLIREPGMNRGVAVVRIEDPRGGSEEYHYRLEWRGGSPGFGSGGRNDGFGGAEPGRDAGEVNFRSNGSGVYYSARGGEMRLGGCAMQIDRRGNARAAFETDQGIRLEFSGRVVRSDRGRVVAQMTGNGLGGEMYIALDNRNNVTEVTFAGQSGRDRFELRWHR